jgi:hypothetical protein
MNLKRRKIYLGQNNLTLEAPTWHRTVLGLFIGIAIMVLTTLLAGCSQNTCETTDNSFVYSDPVDPMVTPKLILRSSKEQSIDPQTIADRSDWPCTTSDVDGGRITMYRQYWYNRQSATADIPDYSYRQMESYQYGESYR